MVLAKMSAAGGSCVSQGKSLCMVFVCLESGSASTSEPDPVCTCVSISLCMHLRVCECICV